MDISNQIEAVYQRALLLRQYALNSPTQQDLLEKAIKEIHFVLEELQTSQEELHQQNQELLTTRRSVELARQRYQELFELAPNGYVVTDKQGKIYQANQYAVTLLGCTLEEYLINKPLLVFINESDRALFQTRLTNLIPGESWEVTLTPRHGVQISVEVAITHLKASMENSDMLLWSLHNITLRKQMSQQLQAAHDRLETRVSERTAELRQANAQLQQEIVEHQQAELKIRDQAALIDIATDAIFVQDLEQQITFWSKGAEELYGWTASDILGKPISLLFPPDATDRQMPGFTQTLEQGSWQAELDQVTHLSKPIVVESRWVLVRDETGQPQSILVVNTDITEKKQLEGQFYRAQRLESLGSLASNISHDLNNIFAPILALSALQLARRPNMDESTQEVWQVVKNSAQQGVELVQQIMLFARGTSGKRIPVQVENLLLEIAKTINRTLPKSIQFITDIPTHPLECVAADPTQLHQIVMNLCVNARDAMPDGGTLTLAIGNREVDALTAQKYLNAHAGDYVMLAVSDTGLGIPSSLMERIFEPFFTTKAPGKGTGLGLSTVFRIVQNHGGFIDVSSQEGKGTQFQVYLPVVKRESSLIQSGEIGKVLT